MNDLLSTNDASVPKVFAMLEAFDNYKTEHSLSLNTYDAKWVEEQAKSNLTDSAFFA